MLVMFPRKVWAAVCQDLRQFGALAAVQSAGAAFRLAVLAAGWVWGGLDLVRVAWLFVLSQIVPSLWEWRMICRGLRRYGTSLAGLPFGAVWRRRGELAGMWRFTGEMYISTSAQALFAQIDTLILGALRSAEEVGYYRLGKSLFLGMTSVGISVARVAYRDFNDLVASGRYDELLSATGRLCRTWLPITLGGTALLAAGAPWLLIRLYGIEYQPAVLPFMLQLIGAAACVGLSWAGYLLFALGRQRRYLLIQVVFGFGVMPLMLLGASLAGATGMAAASSVLWVCHSVALLRSAVSLLRRMARHELEARTPPAVDDAAVPALDPVEGGHA
ncbi:MAG: oligosaccharide flippase family protein [Rubrivivax sp.]|nr:oligosaccharide flippase family protein [Rubrivivax sp.]